LKSLHNNNTTIADIYMITHDVPRPLSMNFGSTTALTVTTLIFYSHAVPSAE